jgi:hypothetical protein
MIELTGKAHRPGGRVSMASHLLQTPSRIICVLLKADSLVLKDQKKRRTGPGKKTDFPDYISLF